MSKLTDTQLIVLSAASARDDGHAVLPEKMKAAAASKVGASLVTRKLMREVRAKPDMPVWRRDDDNRVYSLVLTAAGRKAIGVDESADGPTGKTPMSSKNESNNNGERASATPATGAGKRSTGVAAEPIQAALDAVTPDTFPSGIAVPRAGSKQALVIDMLSGKTGTTLDALVNATGWLPHSARAALTGLRKRGLAIERARADGVSVYRIVSQEPTVSADTKSRVAA